MMVSSDIIFIIAPVAVVSTTVFLTYYFLRMRPYRKATKRMKSDLAELKKKNEQLEKELSDAKKSLSESGQLTMMANLSAGMLHQISQPVTAIYGLVRFVKKEIKEDDPMMESINVVDQQAHYLKEILENLTKIFKHKEVVTADVDINDLVEKSIHILSDELRIGRIESHIRLTDQPIIVHADPVHIQQVFMNIIINAIQALKIFPMTRKRSIYVYSQIYLSEGRAVMSIKNNGPLLTEDQLESIFEPFYSTKRDGSGIGLALCRKLVEEYGGRIVAHTEDGLTEFEITFPIKNEPQE